jgi:threonine/homoserine/homoserine lactone efflux protein
VDRRAGLPVIGSFAALAGVSAVVIVTPGPDTAVTIGSALSGGRRGGLFTALGVCCGQAIWTLAASAGVAALLVASEPAFLAVKYAGAAYLAFLGLHMIRSAIRRRAPGGPDSPGEPGPPGGTAAAAAAAAAPGATRPRGPAASWRRGLLSDLGNPKMAVFFTGLLPQFGTSFATMALLGLVFCAMTLAWLACYSLAVARMGGLLSRARVRRALDAATGTVLIAFGVRLATERA